MMKDKRCIVVVPIYKNHFDYYEKIAVDRAVNVLETYQLSVICPESLDVSEIIKSFPADVVIKRFEDKFFDGYTGYNDLMLSPNFYRCFMDYEYVLICQTDVFVIKNELDRFLKLGYDYIGAPLYRLHPWKAEFYVGNGGFSLRKIKETITLLEDNNQEVKKWAYNEDSFFAMEGISNSSKYNVANLKIASLFAFDRLNKLTYEMNGDKIPMAIHAWCTGDLSWQKRYLSGYLPVTFKWPEYISYENERNNLNEFIESSDHIALFGAGESSMIMVRYMKDILGRSPEFLVVSDGEYKANEVDGVPVYYLNGVASQLKNYSVIVTIMRRYKKLPDFYAMLQHLGAKKVIWPDINMQLAVIEILLKHEKK